VANDRGRPPASKKHRPTPTPSTQIHAPDQKNDHINNSKPPGKYFSAATRPFPSFAEKTDSTMRSEMAEAAMKYST
jgi:hypothetical protein